MLPRGYHLDGLGCVCILGYKLRKSSSLTKEGFSKIQALRVHLRGCGLAWQGVFQMSPIWFYKPWDTFMKVNPPQSKTGAFLPINSCEGWDHRRIWKAAEGDSDPDDPYESQIAVATIDRCFCLYRPCANLYGTCDYFLICFFLKQKNPPPPGGVGAGGRVVLM